MVLRPEQSQFLTALSRIAARNVVRDESPQPVQIGRVHCHVTKDSSPEDLDRVKYLQRKRTQPRGSRQCLGEGCERIVSANAGLCRECRTRIEAADEVAGVFA